MVRLRPYVEHVLIGLFHLNSRAVVIWAYNPIAQATAMLQQMLALRRLLKFILQGAVLKVRCSEFRLYPLAIIQTLHVMMCRGAGRGYHSSANHRSERG